MAADHGDGRLRELAQGGLGGHVFAATLEEHNRNVAAWRGVEASRKGPVAATPVDVPTPPPVRLPPVKPTLKPALKPRVNR